MGKDRDGNRDNLVWMLDDEYNSHELEHDLFKEYGYDLVVTRYPAFKDAYPNYAPLARGILLQVSFPLPGEAIRGLDACQIISRSGGGFDNIDIQAATEKGIPVTYVPGYCVEEVSDHALSLILALNRRLPQCQGMTREGKWVAVDLGPIRRLKGQLLGLVGFGRIARTIARKAMGFGLRVQSFDPYVPQEEMLAQDVQKVELRELVSSSDFISAHVLLTKETYRLFNREVLGWMKPTAYLINTCRGEVVDETALVEALNAGRIAGAGLDVLSMEPPDPVNALLHMPNVIVSPHSAYVSEDALTEVRIRAAMAIVNMLRGKVSEDVINKEVLNKKTLGA